MLVMLKMDTDLRNYLQHHNNLTWEERINIVFDIVTSLKEIHRNKAIHRDLHSGNVLLFQPGFYISDLGFCGPADKPLNHIYGKLPYIAPEVLKEKGYTFASDIYSVGMLMWEISSGQPPFANYKHDDYHLAIKILNGLRPKIMPETPLEYKELMEQCWDADPTKRPDIDYLYDKIFEMNEMKKKSFYLDENKVKQINNNVYYVNSSSIDSSAKNFSKVHVFEDDLPEPRNAIEGKDIKYFK
jgi:serine/threonine protein kinase